MRTLFIFLMAISFAQCCYAGIADPFSWEGTGFRAVWLEGGYASSNNQAASAALGIRFHPRLGVVLGYANDYDFNAGQVNDLMPFGLTPDMTSHVAPTNLGRKRVNGAIGFDVLVFLNPTDNVSVYAGPGAYYQEYRQVYRLNQDSIVFRKGTLVSTTSDKTIELSGGAGVQWCVHQGKRYGFVLTGGYHLHRGISGGIGMSW